MVIDANNLIQFGTAALSAVAAYYAFQARKISGETKEIALKTELNTNSKMDALITATDKAAYAEGKENGRVQPKAERKTP